jgi:DNA (cytosine-5)-methyltransferase 1
MKPRLLDLFCGAGGASTGLAELGLEPFGFDAWPLACESHQANGHATVCADLNTWAWRGGCDLLWASPPCQPFSASGNHDGHLDPRDGMPAFLRAVEEMRPGIVAMENVKGLTFKKHRWYLDACMKRLADLGYRADWRVLNAADYGVPQTRERVIVIARRDDGPLSWPTPTHAKEPGLLGELPWVTMADALGWTGAVGFPRRDDTGTSGDGYRECDWFAVGQPAPHVTGKWRSWTLTRPATTIAGDPRVWAPGHKINADDIAHGRTGQDRAGSNAIRVTINQAAALQGFPPGYVFKGSKTAQFQQVGNAVPPALAKAIVGALLGCSAP